MTTAAADSPAFSKISDARDDSLPLHVRVAFRILDLVRDRGLVAGDKLPSERELGRILGIGYQHARQAIQLLSRDHHLERRVGSGTYLRSSVDVIHSALVAWLRQRPAGRDGLRVGLILLSRGDAFLNHLFEELSAVARSREVEIVIRSAEPDFLGLARAARELAQDGCVGLILVQESGLSTADLVRFVLDSKLPVSLPRRVPGLEASFFEKPENWGSSDRHIIRLGVNYLRHLGRERLVYVGPDSSHGGGALNRIDAFAACAAQHDLAVRYAFLPDDPTAIDACVRGWMEHGAPDGVCCYDDAYAMRLLSSALRCGWNVPEAASVIGVNNTELASHCVPALTSIRFDYRYMAQGVLDHALAGAGVLPPSEQAPKSLDLIIRKSCGGASHPTFRELGSVLSADSDVSVNVSLG